jgi:hypothetical protein
MGLVEVRYQCPDQGGVETGVGAKRNIISIAEADVNYFEPSSPGKRRKGCLPVLTASWK